METYFYNEKEVAYSTNGNQRECFYYKGKRIYFIDSEGKDVSFERWRVCLYYAFHLAETVFFYTEKQYNDFLEMNQKYCHQDYNLWRFGVKS